MRFTEQEVDGHPVLVAEGRIDERLLPRLQAAVDRFDGGIVWLRSAGGDARIARQAAIFLRGNGMTTHIPAGAVCAGACNFLFMGGILRTVDPNGVFMVTAASSIANHDHAELARGPNVVEQIPELSGAAAAEALEENEFLARMGVSRHVLFQIFYEAHSRGTRESSYCLSGDELKRHNIVPLTHGPNPGTR